MKTIPLTCPVNLANCLEPKVIKAITEKKPLTGHAVIVFTILTINSLLRFFHLYVKTLHFQLCDLGCWDHSFLYLFEL
ncbi:hypothetical protein BCV72DRAFT_314522, partial [Rhizopus microsporus var. microsporus]